MKHAKNFDCVEMKNSIQKRLLSERKDMTNEEIRNTVEKEIETSQSPIADLWRRIKDRTKSSSQEVASKS